MHAAARGLRRPGDSPAVQQHLPRCSHRDPGNRANDAIRPRPPALSGRSWTRARGSRLRAPPNSSRGRTTPRYSPQRESTGRSSTGRAAGAFGGVCRRLKRMAPEAGRGALRRGAGGFALQRQLEADQRRHAEAAHAPLQALTAGRRALTALRGCGADAGPSGALAGRDHRRGPRRGSAAAPGGSPALRVAARATNRAHTSQHDRIGLSRARYPRQSLGRRRTRIRACAIGCIFALSTAIGGCRAGARRGSWTRGRMPTRRVCAPYPCS